MSQHTARWRLILGAGLVTTALVATGCAGAGGGGGTATLVSLPVLIAGFTAPDKLVRALSLGAVK
jgi:hypothetical protein